MYNYGYDYGSTLSSDSAVGVLLAVFGVIFLFAFIIGLLVIIGQWKVLTKAGKPGWGALIPFYNTYLLCQVTGLNPYWVLVLLCCPVLSGIPVIGILVSLVPIYFTILLNVSIAKSFGKSEGYAVGLILLSPIFYMILGFDKSEYQGPKPMRDFVFEMIDKNKKDDTNTTANNTSSSTTVNSTVDNMNTTTTDMNSVVPPVNTETITDTNVTDNVDANENPNVDTKVCPSCGSTVSSDSNFCTNCGTEIK